jgi:hypothetical protein
MRATEKIKILLGVLTAIAVVLPVTASAQVIWEADADRGTSVFEGLERSPGEIGVVSDPKGMFGNVFRYTIWDNPDGSKDRCESRGHRLTDGATLRLTRGNTYYIGWRALWDSNVGTQAGRWVALWQMHAYGGPGMGAPLVFRTLGDGMLHLQNNVEGTNQHIWSTTLRRDVWNTFVIGAHLDPDPEKGWVELWYNGVQQKFINGKTRFFCPTHESEPDTFNKLKWGIYRTGPATGRWNAWMSGARIGLTLADVMDDTPPPPGTLSFEAENLTVINSGTGTSIQTDPNTSEGRWVSLDAENAGSWMEFVLPNVPAGAYTLRMSYKTNSNRGQLDVRVDDVFLGGALDQYRSPSTYETFTIGAVTFGSTGNHRVRLRVTGKNSSSSSYVLSADRFILN